MVRQAVATHQSGGNDPGFRSAILAESGSRLLRDPLRGASIENLHADPIGSYAEKSMMIEGDGAAA